MEIRVSRTPTPFLGRYSASNEIEIRSYDGDDPLKKLGSQKVVLAERVGPQIGVICLLLAFGFYLAFVLFFHFEKINGGAFGVSVMAIGAMVGLGFGSKALVRFYLRPIIEFDLLGRAVLFLSESRHRRKIVKSIPFSNVRHTAIRSTTVSMRKNATEVYILELVFTDANIENVPLCVSGDRKRLEDVQNFIAVQTGLRS